MGSTTLKCHFQRGVYLFIFAIGGTFKLLSIELKEHGIYNAKNKSWATFKLCLGSLFSLVTRNHSYSKLAKFGGTNSMMGGFIVIQFGGDTFQSRHIC